MVKIALEWTENNVSKLTRMWQDGYSATLIAKEMSPATRSAIIGKAHRLNLPPHGHKPPLRIIPFRPVKKRKPSVDKKPALDPIEEDVSPVEYLKLKSYHCRALLDERGSDGLRLSCGRIRLRGSNGLYLSSYCPMHDRLYAPSRYQINRRN